MPSTMDWAINFFVRNSHRISKRATRETRGWRWVVPGCEDCIAGHRVRAFALCESGSDLSRPCFMEGRGDPDLAWWIGRLRGSAERGEKPPRVPARVPGTGPSFRRNCA